MAMRMKLAAVLAGLCLAWTGGVHAALLYGMDAETDNLVTINTRSGAVKIIGNLPGPGADFGGLDFDSTGQLYVMKAGGRLLRVDASDASGVQIGPQRDQIFESFEIIGNKGYAAYHELETLYEINLRTGMPTLIGSQNADPGQLEGVIGLASSHGVLYGTRFVLRDIVRLNRNTGAVDQVVGVHGLAGLTSLTFAEGVLWGIPARSNDLYSIDPTTGVATLVNGNLSNVPHITGLTAAVPEPSVLTLAMVATPLLLVFAYRTRETHHRRWP